MKVMQDIFVLVYMYGTYEKRMLPCSERACTVYVASV